MIRIKKKAAKFLQFFPWNCPSKTRELEQVIHSTTTITNLNPLSRVHYINFNTSITFINDHNFPYMSCLTFSLPLLAGESISVGPMSPNV